MGLLSSLYNPKKYTPVDVGALPVDANAVSATKLAQALQLIFSGDVSGSVSFNGDEGTINVNLQTGDDTHNHIMANIDGLAGALSGKAALSHNHAAGNITSGVLSSARLPAGSTGTRGALLKPYFSKSSNGFWRCQESKIMMQWGRLDPKLSNSSVTFPLAFSSTNYAVTTTTDQGASASWSRFAVSGRATGYFNYVGGNATYAYWIALGY